MTLDQIFNAAFSAAVTLLSGRWQHVCDLVRRI